MRNRKNIIIAVMIAVVLLMITGYAAFRTQLNINATGNITSEWNVYFESISKGTPVGGALNNFAPSVTGTTAVMSADLSVPGDSMTYDIKLTNSGTIGAIIEDIEAISEGSNAIIFSITGIKKGDKLASKSSVTFQVKIEYDDVTDVPKDSSTELTVNIKAVQDTGQKIESEDIIIDGQNDNLLVTQILGRNKSNVVSSGDGLYVSTATNDESPTYYYKGNVTNNYVKFGSQSVEGHCKVKDEYASLYGNIDLSSCDEEAVSQEYLESGNGVRGVVCNDNGSYFYTTAMVCGMNGYEYIDGVLEWSEEESFIWRIVRINEDGTIKLILDDRINNTDNPFNPNYDSYKYMYYSESNITNGIKNTVDTWYTNTLEENYDSYIATTNFCESAKVKTDRSDSSENTTMELVENYTPNFKCEEDGNGKEYVNEKAALITADEVAMAGIPFGAWSQTNNTTTYLQKDYYWWTMSPAGNCFYLETWDASAWYVANDGTIYNANVANGFGVRPVISLNANVTIVSSNGKGVHGSSTNPYVIKIN